MKFTIIPGLTVGQWQHRTEEEHDLVVSIISSKIQTVKNKDGQIELFSEPAEKYSLIPGKEVIHIDLTDDGRGLKQYVLAHGWKIIRLIQEGKKVFIHCNKARNRSPSFAIGLLVLKGMKLEDAYNIVVNSMSHPDHTLSMRHNHMIELFLLDQRLE